MNTEKSPKMQRARDDVNDSIAKIEDVVGDVKTKVKDTSQKFDDVVDFGVRLKDKAKDAAAPIWEKSREMGRQVSERVQENPRPYIYGALAVIGGYFLLRMARNRRSA